MDLVLRKFDTTMVSVWWCLYCWLVGWFVLRKPIKHV